MKNTRRLLVLLLLALPLQVSLHADGDKAKAVHSFEFKVAKQRDSRDKKGNSTAELWSYKVEVENKSLEDVGELDVKYTLYISSETQTGGARKETTRSVSGEASLDAIPRGNSSSFETNSSPLKQSTKVERSKSKKRAGNNNKKKTQTKVTEVTEKLDGIRVQLFLDGKKVGEHVVGDAAKRAQSKGKK